MHHQEYKKNASYLAFNRPKSPTSREEAELIEKSSKALPQATDPLERLRLMCLSCGAGGIMRLCRILRGLDVDGSNHLKKEVFLDGLTDTGLDISDDEARALYKRFDPNDTGTINLDNFLEALRPPMSDGRRAVVRKAFQMIDKNGSGSITYADLRKAYSPKGYPRYMNGDESAETVGDKFLLNFATKNTPDAVITFEQFMDFYNGISVGFENDCYFDLMMRQDYNL